MSEKPLRYHSVREVYRWSYPPNVVPAQTLGTLDSSSKNQFTKVIQIVNGVNVDDLPPQEPQP